MEEQKLGENVLGGPRLIDVATSKGTGTNRGTEIGKKRTLSLRAEEKTLDNKLRCRTFQRNQTVCLVYGVSQRVTGTTQWVTGKAQRVSALTAVAASAGCMTQTQKPKKWRPFLQSDSHVHGDSPPRSINSY